MNPTRVTTSVTLPGAALTLLCVAKGAWVLLGPIAFGAALVVASCLWVPRLQHPTQATKESP
jgi:hypothetical protein